MDFIGQRVFSAKLRLMGFGCVHYGDEGHDGEKFKEFLKEVESTNNAVIFGLGDYFDFTRQTYRAPLKMIGPEDDKFHREIDSLVLKTYIEPLAALIKTYAPSFSQKTICLCQGNHTHKFLSGETSDMVLARLLGIRYGGLASWVRLTVYRSRGKEKLGSGHNLNILLNHMAACSSMLPYGLAAAQRKLDGWRGVDVFLTGHDHQLGSMTRDEIGCTSRGQPMMLQHQSVIGKVGSFQKGYDSNANSESYVERKLMRPNRLGWLAFDAWQTFDHQAGGERVHKQSETWRFGNFSA